jgi:subfamily B ATP-binding cassette protein MsbA
LRLKTKIKPDISSPAEPTAAQLLPRFLNSYIKKHAVLIIVAFLLMSLEGATLGALSWLIQPLFDKVFTSGSMSMMFGLGLAIMGLFILRAISSICSRTLMSFISQRVLTAMQTDMLTNLLKLDLRYYQQNSPGKLIEQVQGDTMAVQGIWSLLLSAVGRDLVALIGLFIVALNVDPIWTLATLVAAPLLILPSLSLRNYIRVKAFQTRNQAGTRAERLDEIFHGIQAVKLNRLEDYQISRFRSIIHMMRRFEVRSSAGRAAMPAVVDIVTGIGFCAVLVLAGKQIAAGERTVGEFMSFFTAMALTFQPIRRLSENAGNWQIAALSLERVYRILDARSASKRPPVSTIAPPSQTPDIVVRDLRFSHGEMPVLNGVSFTAAAGRTTALVGASGAGKSTLFHLLTGLYEPDQGQIIIGGVDSRDLSLHDLRGLFASVTQDSALFDETLRENVLLGRNDIPEDRFRAALDDALVSDFLPLLANDVETRVGPRGSALSGGQRQRVSIARAIVQNTPVLLLDEATSALDAASETAVAEALSRAAARGRTTLVIAHRLATVRDADKILVMDQGRVIESGTHQELLAKSGLYAMLYSLQFKDGSEDKADDQPG